jgi:hypothetical protein
MFDFWKKVGKQKEMTHFHHHHLVVNQMLNLWDRIELDIGILEQKWHIFSSSLSSSCGQSDAQFVGEN